MSLNLLDVPYVDNRYEASRDVAFQPALIDTRPITFSIPASDDYYDLNELRFQVKVRLTDPATGYPVLKASLANSYANNTRNTYCVNNSGHTILRDINTSMNGVLMTEQSNTYYYKAYMETLLNYNRRRRSHQVSRSRLGQSTQCDCRNGSDWRQFRYSHHSCLEWKCRIASVDQPIAERDLAHLHHLSLFATPQDG